VALPAVTIAGDPLRGNGIVVESLTHAITSGEHGLSTVPGLLARVLSEKLWLNFRTKRGELIHYDSFAEFATTPPLRGLGVGVDLIRQIIANDVVAVDLLDQALQRPHGGDHTSSGSKVHIVNLAPPPRGNSESAALRRLRKDRPDLHGQVLNKELTAHAAMVQAGFRPKTFTVRADDPESLAATLRRQLDPEVLAQLKRLIG
jgi:hypothetical protein